MLLAMPRLRRIAAILLCTFGLAVVVAIAAFELAIVRPVLAKAERLLAGAADGECNPPRVVVAILRGSLGERLKYHVARDLLSAVPSQVEKMRTLRRQFAEQGVGFALDIHLSQQEIFTIYTSLAYMGPGVQGFCEASTRYIGTPLKDINRTQAAKLVAIAHAPSIYLNSPNALEKRIQYLLSLSQE